MVVLEVDAFLLATTAQHQERQDSQCNTSPLPSVQPFAKDQQSAYEYHHRTRGIDGTNDGQRQVFHAKIAQHPTREHDKCLEQHVLMFVPSARSDEENGIVERLSGSTQDDKRQEDKR